MAESVRPTGEPPSAAVVQSMPERTMAKRILTAIAAGAIVLGALFTTHAFPVFLLVIAAGVFGFIELVKIAGLEDRPLAGLTIGLLCYVAPVFVAWATRPGSWPFWSTVWAAYLAGCFGVYQGLKRGYATPMSAGWLGAPLATILVTHQQTVHGPGAFAGNLSLMLVLPLWAGDSVALFVGKAIGRHKLAPNISPNKTWEGAIGNFLACVATAALIGHWLELPLAASVMVGAISGLFGQIGDLAQSALKRVSGLKDSGGILPGHGGLLDRVDSFLLSSVPSATVMWLFDGSHTFFHMTLWH